MFDLCATMEEGEHRDDGGRLGFLRCVRASPELYGPRFLVLIHTDRRIWKPSLAARRKRAKTFGDIHSKNKENVSALI
jgi:hypothetical protein